MMHHSLRWLVVMSVVCLIGFGCAKKQIASQGTQPVVQEQTGQQTEVRTQMQQDDTGELEREQQELLAEEQRLETQRLQEEWARQEARLEEAKQTLETESIYFDFDSFELTPQSRTILQRKATILREMPDLKMRIEGHCDERGTDEYNLALGEKRARVAYEFLILLGVAPQRLQIISYGEEYPVSTEHNETAWALNRRDAFNVFTH